MSYFGRESVLAIGKRQSLLNTHTPRVASEKECTPSVSSTWMPWQKAHWKAIFVTSGLTLFTLTTVPWMATHFPADSADLQL